MKSLKIIALILFLCVVSVSLPDVVYAGQQDIQLLTGNDIAGEGNPAGGADEPRSGTTDNTDEDETPVGIGEAEASDDTGEDDFGEDEESENLNVLMEQENHSDNNESDSTEEMEEVITVTEPGDGSAENPFIITTAEEFDNICDDLTASYKLVADIDFEGETLAPIGTSSASFTGTLDGGGHVISNYKISAASSYTGLFGYAREATIKDIVIENAEVKHGSSYSYIGGLAGYLYRCTIENVSLSGIAVSGGQYAGGLAGYMNEGSISGCSVNGTVSSGGSARSGGLIGYLYLGNVLQCFAEADVSGGTETGGLIGFVQGTLLIRPSLTQCYASGDVTGISCVGGLVGKAECTVVSDAFAIGSVRSTSNHSYTAGLVGYAKTVLITNGYAAGPISTGGSGLAYITSATVTGSYFDVFVAGVNKTDSNNVGKMTPALMYQDFFAGWNFESIWNISEGETYPYLKNLSEPDWGERESEPSIVGAGTEEHPYLIEEKEQLQYIGYELSAVYQLISDINLEGGAWVPIGTSAAPFTGIFDGGGHVISDYKINTASNYAGLFGYAKAATLKNIQIENAEVNHGLSYSYIGGLAGYLDGCATENIGLSAVTVTGGQYTGGLAGYMKEGSMSGCSVLGTVSSGGKARAGGLIGYLESGTAIQCFAAADINGGTESGGMIGYIKGTSSKRANLTECYVSGAVTGTSYVGGLAGRADYTDISNSFTIGSVTSTSNHSYTAGLIGYTANVAVTNSYSAGPVTAGGSGLVYVYSATTVSASYFDILTTTIIKSDSYNAGKLTPPLMMQEFFVGWDFEETWDISEGETYPYLRSLGEPDWNERSSVPLITGAGTVENPYLIEELEQFSYIGYELSAAYKLASDIDLAGGTWIPVGTLAAPFTGSFDGGGHRISDFVINAASSYNGLFGYAKTATLKNLEIDNAEIKQSSSYSYIGGLAGYLEGCTTSNISLSGITVSGGMYTGGLAGYMIEGSMSGCSVRGRVSSGGKARVGGLIAHLTSGAVTQCFAEADVSGSTEAGGLIGYVQGTASKRSNIKECYASGAVTGTAYIGGLTGGANYTDISDSFAIGSVTSTSNHSSAAGLIGSATNVAITNGYAAGSVSTGGNGLVTVSSSTTVAGAYFDILATGIMKTDSGNVGKMTSALMLQDFFADWDFGNIWDMVEGESYPYLQSLGVPDWGERDLAPPITGAGTVENPYLIEAKEQFIYVGYELSAAYQLVSDIYLAGGTWVPIGTAAAPFTGIFDGGGHVISDFKINAASYYVGFFGYANAATIKNMIIENADIKQSSSYSNIGGLAGGLSGCTTENISLSNITVSGGQNTGGIVGGMSGGSMSGCSFNGSVSSISSARAGGLIAHLASGTVTQCFAEADVSGGTETGGLIGFIQGSVSQRIHLTECYASGDVTGTTYVGGLAGRADYADIQDIYAIGNVLSTTNNIYTAGLVGCSNYITVTNGYAAGTVSAAGVGLVRVYVSATSTITNAYFDSDLSGKTAAGQSKTTEQLLTQDTYVGWDWENIWEFHDDAYPTLKNIVNPDLRRAFALTFRDLTYDSVVIEWTDISGADGYELTYAEMSVDMSETSDETSISEYVNLSEAFVDSLRPDTAYEFKVRILIDGKEGMWSEPLSIRTEKLVFKMDGLHSTQKGNGSITLEWNKATGADSYVVTYNGRMLRTDTNTCVLTGIEKDTPYVIRVMAEMTGGFKMTSSPIIEKIYDLNPQTDYAREFINQCDGQTWFIDEIENLLNLKGQSVNTLRSRDDLSTIYALGLADRNISGEIPAAIGELKNLRYLYLANNNLSGELPAELYTLAHLSEMDLTGNSFEEQKHEEPEPSEESEVTEESTHS